MTVCYDGIMYVMVFGVLFFFFYNFAVFYFFYFQSVMGELTWGLHSQKVINHSLDQHLISCVKPK